MTQSANPESSDEKSAAIKKSAAAKTNAPKSRLPAAPATGSGVNLAMAEIILRAGADRMRGKVNSDISIAEAEKRKAGLRDAVDGRSLITSVALYSAAKLATRSRAGLGLVVSGLLAKSLYERGKKVRKRRGD